MSVSILGIPDNKMKFHQRTFFREAVGLERIQEEYIFSTLDFEQFSSNVLFNGAKQKDVADFVDWSSGEEIQYDRMVIERIEYQPISGGLTHAFVTYVGLYSTEIPKPIITIQGILDRNWLFNNYAAIVQFVSYIGEPGSIDEIRAVSGTYARGTIHKKINEYSIPQGSNPPSTLPVNARLSWNLGWINCPFFREECSETFPDGPGGEAQENLTSVIGSVFYTGFSVYSMNVERFGLYGVFRLDIRDQATYNIGYTSFLCGQFSTTLPPCTSYLNTPVNANPV